MTKMRRVKYSTNQIKVEKTRFGKVNPLNDVIHVAKIVKLRRFFPAISGRRYCLSPFIAFYFRPKIKKRMKFFQAAEIICYDLLEKFKLAI